MRNNKTSSNQNPCDHIILFEVAALSLCLTKCVHLPRLGAIFPVTSALVFLPDTRPPFSMALLGIVFNSVRYLVAQCMHVAFAPEVRKNPTIIHAETQSDDYTGGGRNAIPKELDAGGAFKPQYVAPLRRPRNSIEAQRLYNHIRTLAFYLDAIPFLGRRLPFNVGVEVSEHICISI